MHLASWSIGLRVPARLRIVFTMIAISGAAATAAAEPDECYLPPDPMSGAAIFSEMGCEDCHVMDGSGGRFGPDLARSGEGRSLLDIFGLMWSHSPQMSRVMEDLRLERKTFTGDQLAELAAYVYVTAYFDKAGDSVAGKKAFAKKSCVRCHRVDGIGESIGPDLTAMRWYVSPIFLVQMMWNHGPSIKSSMDEHGVSWPELDGSDVVDIMAFLREESDHSDEATATAGTGNSRKGWELFKEKNCVSCHTLFDVGTPIGPDLAKSDFHKSATSIAVAMWNHGPAIWKAMEDLGVSRASLVEDDLVDLAAFLYFLRFSEDPENQERGEALFEQKGCGSCHHFRDGATDDSYSLIFDSEDVTGLEIAAAMWNDAEAMSTAAIRKRIPWPYFEPGEISDVISYILSQNNRARAAGTD